MPKQAIKKTRFLAGKQKMLFIVCLAATLGYTLLKIGRLYIIYPWFEAALLINILVANSVLLSRLIKHTTKTQGGKVGLHILLVVCTICLVCVVALAGFLWSLKKYQFIKAPNHNAAVVIFASGFIDKTYEAYPRKFMFWYVRQNNGHLSYHDFWDNDAAQVHWVSEKAAYVTVKHANFHPYVGSNANDRIEVFF